jgi:hypothetical protein
MSNQQLSTKAGQLHLRDLRERERFELRRDLAQEPCPIALGTLAVLALPLAVSPMLLGVGLATLVRGARGRARVFARGGLRCEGLASCFDRTEPALPARLRQARLAIAAPAL